MADPAKLPALVRALASLHGTQLALQRLPLEARRLQTLEEVTAERLAKYSIP